jgi:hypothetical protein
VPAPPAPCALPDDDPRDVPKLPPPLAQPASKAVNNMDAATTPLLRDVFMMYFL